MSHWYYKQDDREVGPLPFTELVALVRQGVIAETSLVRRGEIGAWLHAWTIPVLFAAAERRDQAPRRRRSKSRLSIRARQPQDWPLLRLSPLELQRGSACCAMPRVPRGVGWWRWLSPARRLG